MPRLHGVHVPHLKNTRDAETERLPMPSLLKIPMSMHIGTPCTPTVKVRDKVLAGQKIGDATAFVAVPVHAGVSGTVRAITTYHMSDGRTCPMVEIETDPALGADPSVAPPKVKNREDFLAALRESGLAGMGGACFPTHVKLAAKQPIDTLIINAAECEPYITSDCRQMIEAPGEVIDGILQVLHWLQIPKALIGVESNKPEAIRLLNERAKPHPEISLQILPAVYPQGAEKVLIYHTLGRVVMEGQLPADQGVIVMNVSTVAFVSRYLKTGMPMTERRVTVDGDAVGRPCNVFVPIGTPVEKVFTFANYNPEKAKKLLYGGPMMGIAIPDAQDPILKANNAILAFSNIHAPKPTPCIRCGRCYKRCPLRLMPTVIAKAFEARDVEALRRAKVALCMNCGCCSYACPAKRPVAETNQLAKAFLQAATHK